MSARLESGRGASPPESSRSPQGRENKKQCKHSSRLILQNALVELKADSIRAGWTRWRGCTKWVILRITKRMIKPKPAHKPRDVTASDPKTLPTSLNRQCFALWCSIPMYVLLQSETTMRHIATYMSHICNAKRVTPCHYYQEDLEKFCLGGDDVDFYSLLFWLSGKTQTQKKFK